MTISRDKKCIIFAAGTYYGLCKAIHSPSSDDLIIAADAGYINCCQSGLTPGIVLGDFDSMDEPQLSNDSETIRVPVEKDDTDTMLAIKTGLEHGCSEFHIYGGTGGKRLDHTIANIQALAYLAAHDARGYLYDDNAVYTAIKDASICIHKVKDWGLFSVFCLGEAASGVDIIGAQYPLENGKIDAYFPIGVSNHFGDADNVTVSVASGCLLVGWELK